MDSDELVAYDVSLYHTHYTKAFKHCAAPVAIPIFTIEHSILWNSRSLRYRSLFLSFGKSLQSCLKGEYLDYKHKYY